MGNILGTFLGVLLSPIAQLRRLKEEGESVGIKSSVIFVLVMGVISGLLTAIIGMFVEPAAIASGQIPKASLWLAVVLVPLFSLLGCFISAFFFWGITDGLFKGSMDQYKTTVRLLALPSAYYPISALLGAIPKVGQYIGIAINVWILIYIVWGLIAVKAAKPVQTIVISIILAALLGLIGGLAYFSAQNQLGRSQFDGFEGGLGAAGNEDFDLDALLQEEADKVVEQKAPKGKK